jgi:hypothetical protein
LPRKTPRTTVTADARGDARRGDGGVREELAVYSLTRRSLRSIRPKKLRQIDRFGGKKQIFGADKQVSGRDLSD